jgi:hypothetical protein
MLRLSNLKLSIEQDKNEILPKLIAKTLNISKKEIKSYRIFKESIDARKEEMIYFVYTVDVEVGDRLEEILVKRGYNLTPDYTYIYPEIGSKRLENPPVVVGAGPAGLFCGLILSQLGYNPIIIERGEDVEKRTERVEKFWREGILNTESNVQFGEGGAGTFSDGKLTTLIKDKRCRKVLEEMVKGGAPGEILYSYKPHVGTDILKLVVKNIREQIIANGGKVYFNTKLENLIIKNGKIYGIKTNKGEIPAHVLVLALGHSARDTFQVLYNNGLNIEQKAFSIGVRIEHPQSLINKAQYKKFAGHPRLGAAEYKLAYHSPNGRSAYTFCMCPGGLVVAAASEEGGVVTNGMSYHSRDGENANSALLVGVTPKDFESSHPLAGIEFQRKWERKAFQVGGGNYFAPAQLVGDFLQDKESEEYRSVVPTYKKGVKMANLKDVLPDYVIDTLKEAILDFDKKLKGFADKDAILTGVETRSSSPIRILRDERYQSNIQGIYPCGEGAGYAGGIISAAVDGIKIAEKIISEWRI